ncbi:MAG: TlpA disulfide reductase family protein [Enhygromyxa sp.]
MPDRAARLAWVCLLAALGCRPEPAPTQAPDPGGPTAALGTSPTDDQGSAPELDDGAVEAVEAVEPVEPVMPEGQAEPEPNADPRGEGEGEAKGETRAEAQPVASAEAKQRPPLPKPIHKPGDGKCVKKFAVGDKVKNFRLPSLAGDKTISPAGYRKRVVLLNFWATWCKPCLEELPEFDRLYRKYRSHGMTLVAVTTDEDPKPVQAFVDQHKLVAKIALEGDAAASAYDRPQFPFSFVVDGDGTIVAAFDFVDDSCLGDLEQVIRSSLEQLD